MMPTQLGSVHIYTGPGKGKTTAALGLCMRALGHNLKVKIIQFIKGSSYAGELATLNRLAPYGISLEQYGLGCPYSAAIRQGEEGCRSCGQCFISRRGVTDEDLRLANRALQRVQELLRTETLDLLVLDEIGNALRFGLITMEQVINLIRTKPPKLELILTGRGIPEELYQYADLVTEVRALKHPYANGVKSRRGVEY